MLPRFEPPRGRVPRSHEGTRRADPNADYFIGLFEVLHVNQFFNSDGYTACPTADPPTEDGYCLVST